MRWYRLYLLNAAGKVRHIDEIQAADDAAALRQAGALCHGFGVEVRRGSQRIGLVSGQAPAGEPPSPAA